MIFLMLFAVEHLSQKIGNWDIKPILSKVTAIQNTPNPYPKIEKWDSLAQRVGIRNWFCKTFRW